MESFTYTISDELGIHARPAGMLVKQAGQFQCDVKLVKGEKSVDAKRVFSVMGLGVRCGDVVRVDLEGLDEVDAATELKAFFEQNL